jgi:PAS domain S-box-containing protein
MAEPDSNIQTNADAGQPSDQTSRRLRTLIETLPHGVAEFATDGTITYSNAAHHAMLGYAEGSLLGQPIWSTLENEKAAADMRTFIAYLVRVQPVLSSYTARNLTHDGRVIDVQIDWNYTRDADGALTGFISVITEVTERERALRALRLSHSREREIHSRLTALHDLGIALSRTSSIDALCRMAVERGRQDLGFDRLSVWLGLNSELFARGTYGIDEHGNLRNERDCITDVSGNSPLQRVLSRETPTVHIPDTDLLNHRAQKVGRGALAAAALWDGEHVIGALMMDNLLGGVTPDEHQIELLTLYASTLGHLISRLQAETALRERAEFENLIARISTDFINLPADNIDRGLNSALRAIGEFNQADRCFILAVDHPPTTVTLTHEWRNRDVQMPGEPRRVFELTRFPWLAKRIRGCELIDITNVADLDDSAAAEREEFQRAGSQSILAVPMLSATGLFGYVGYISMGTSRTWDSQVIALLTIVGQMLVNALDRQRVELALQKSERRYRGLVETQQDLIVRVNPQGQFTFVNDAYCQKFDRQREDLLGQRHFPFAGDGARDWTVDVLRRLQAPPHRFRYEQQTHTPRGNIWIAWEDYAIKDSNGKIVEIQAVGRDITDLKRAEEESRRHLDELAHVTRLNTMGEMATSLAHELNQPLSAISNYLAAATRRMRREPKVCEDVMDDLKLALLQTRRAGQFVRHIKDFIRKKEPHRTAVNINTIATESVELLDDFIRSHGVSVAYQLDPDLPPARADQIQIQQVIINLVRNATEAMAALPPDRTRRINLRSTRLEGGFLAMYVTDTGPGIEVEDFDNLFSAFYTTKIDGTGLGLSISRSIVEANGGTLSAARNPVDGLTFCFTLPAFKQAEENSR